jgi:hypothetical protein
VVIDLDGNHDWDAVFVNFRGPQFFTGDRVEAVEASLIARGEEDDLLLSAKVHDDGGGVGVADVATFPEFLACFFIPSGDSGFFSKGHHDEGIANNEGTLGVTPVGGLGIRVAVGEFDFPVGFLGFAVDAEDLAKGAEEVDGILLYGGDAAGAGEGWLTFRGVFKAPLFFAGYEVEADQHVFFLVDAVAEEDLPGGYGSPAESAFEFGLPKDLGTTFGEGFEESCFGGGGVGVRA